MGKLKFSVSICVYGKDNPQDFETAMNSIIEQTVVPDEIILVVDGPIPNTIQEVIKNIKDKYEKLIIYYLKENVGHGKARKIGLDKCQYSIVAIMDADDICVHDRFLRQITCFEKDSSLSIVGGNIKEFLDDATHVVGCRIVPMQDSEIKQCMKDRCPMNQVTVMFKKEDVINAGGYIDWYCEEDYYLWIRMAQKGYRFYNIGECLVYVRVSDEMYQRRGGWRYFSSEARIQLYMLKNQIIGLPRYSYNVLGRLFVQVLMPNWIRSLLFQRVFRSSECNSKQTK